MRPSGFRRLVFRQIASRFRPRLVDRLAEPLRFLRLCGCVFLYPGFVQVFRRTFRRYRLVVRRIIPALDNLLRLNVPLGCQIVRRFPGTAVGLFFVFRSVGHWRKARLRLCPSLSISLF